MDLLSRLHTGTTGVLGPGFWGTRRLANLAGGYSKSPAPERPVVPVCKINSCKINRLALELFYIEERRGYFIMGRGRKGLTEQSLRKPKRTDGARHRGTPIAFPIGQKRETKKYQYLNMSLIL